MKPMKFIFSGGGTGGHIFPAIAIANLLKERHPEAEFLFVGAIGKMEMEKVPQEGYQIIGLPIEGLKRSFSLKNIAVAYKSIKSYFLARNIIRSFKPTAVIGTGGFASLPICYAAAIAKVPVFVWEGNGYAGLTNKIMSKKATKIFCGFDQMEPYFKHGNWIHSGNPIRKDVIQKSDKSSAAAFFNLNPQKPILFITGGSLGARVLNECISKNLPLLTEKGIQLIWQTGNYYKIPENLPTGIWAKPFLREMNMAYSCADLVISRSGALSCSEISAAGVPAILVPSKNVTDDHQTKNAQHVTRSGGAILVTDNNAPTELINKAIEIIQQPDILKKMSASLLQSAKPEATETIVNLIEESL